MRDFLDELDYLRKKLRWAEACGDTRTAEWARQGIELLRGKQTSSMAKNPQSQPPSAPRNPVGYAF